MTANRPGDLMVGMVGTVIPGVTVGIQSIETGEIIAQINGEEYPTNLSSEAGEILCKGPNVMKGYWRNDEATKEMIDPDGWLHTGDVGRFVDGYLKITDRIKHMLVNAGGKNIYPGPIEDMFKSSKWIDQLVVVGEAQNFMAALIVPDFDALKKFANSEGISYADTDELLELDEVKSVYKKEMVQFSRIWLLMKKFVIFAYFQMNSLLKRARITPTMKVKRRVIAEKYAHLISDIFKGD